ncbi:MAG: hypothetical protein WC307_00140 [Candidatus Nanoarchaeia archaeon]|jgi:chromosome segregation ATPase
MVKVPEPRINDPVRFKINRLSDKLRAGLERIRQRIRGADRLLTKNESVKRLVDHKLLKLRREADHLNDKLTRLQVEIDSYSKKDGLLSSNISKLYLNKKKLMSKIDSVRKLISKEFD